MEFSDYIKDENEQLKQKVFDIERDNKLLLEALNQHFDDDIKRHANRIKFFGTPDEREPDEIKAYHFNQIENIKKKKEALNERFGG